MPSTRNFGGHYFYLFLKKKVKFIIKKNLVDGIRCGSSRAFRWYLEIQNRIEIGLGNLFFALLLFFDGLTEAPNLRYVLQLDLRFPIVTLKINLPSPPQSDFGFQDTNEKLSMRRI